MAVDSRPIYMQIADQLHAHAGGAGAGGAAPSVRKLARQFGVSSVTASRALQLYRGQRTPAKEGGASRTTTERWAVCLHVSPGPHQHAAAQLTADGFRALAQESRVEFDFDSLRIGGDGENKSLRACVAAAVENGAGGVFLLPSRVSDEDMRLDEELVQACTEAGVPVVLIERNLRGEDRPIEHDLVCFHDFEGGRLLAGHLLEQGRKRIAFLTGSPTNSHLERLAGYLSALHSAGVSESLVMSLAVTTTPGDAYTELVTKLLDWRADGVICFHEYAAVGLIMELLRRRKTIPDDIAVADFYSLGLGESFSIGITSYAFPARTVAARALDTMRWRLKNPLSPPLKSVIPGELIIRNSTVAGTKTLARKK